MSRLLFTAFIALDAVALGLFFVLGLAAAKPSHTPLLSVVAFFVLPGLALASLVLLFLHGPWAASRTLATLMAALPVLLAVGGAAVSGGVAWWMGESVDGWGRPDPQAQQRLEQAIAAGDAAAVARLGANPRAPVNEGAALVAALRLLEAHPQRLEPLQALLQAGMSANAAGGPEAPLEAAIRVSRHAGAEPVRLLLRGGADPNFRLHGEPAWFAALSSSTDPSVLPALLAAGADLRALDAAGNTGLYWAVFHRNWSAVRQLVERGAAWRHARLPDGQGLLQAVDAQQRRHPTDADLARLAQRLREAPTAD